MTIALNSDLLAFLDEQVRAGKYTSVEEAVADAVTRLKAREEKIGWLRHELQSGVEELERGEGAEWDAQELKDSLRSKYPQS